MKVRRNEEPRVATIEITIDPSLLDHFIKNLSNQNSRIVPEDAITGLVATILDSSAFPIKAKQTGGRKIRVAYHLRSFSQPIF